MSDEKKNSGRADISEDEVVARIVSDPNNPDVKRVTGFALGKSSRDGYWRLYLNVDLSHYLEFEKSATLHAKQFREGRTVVWLKSGTRVIETKARSAPVDFLEGEISRGFARGFSGVSMVMNAADCPGSGCAHCTASCSSLPGGGGDSSTIGYTCGC